MFRKIFKLSLLGILIFSLSACLSSPKNEIDVEIIEEEKLVVAATIFPIYDLVKEVGGDKVEAYLILKPGASPHTYESLPSQVKALQAASLFFYNGLGLDDWAKDLGRDSSAQLVNLSENVETRNFEEGHGLDPHYWLSPSNAKLMIEAITNYLAKEDSDNVNYYQARAQSYIFKLDQRIIVWQEKLSNLENRDLVFFHGAWNYFADYFDLKIVANFEPFPGKTPSPQYIINLKEAIGDHNVKTLFIEPQLSKKSLMGLASDLGVEIETLDPLGGVAERLSYLDLMDYNIETIYKALSN